MDKSIGVGLIVGLVIATTLYVYSSDRFNKIQKGILYVCIVFPPAQWLLILIFLGINYTINENSKERKEEKVIEKESTNHSDKLQTLKDLHEQKILTDDEYYEKSAKLKSEKLQTELKLTDEYKKLKSLYDADILTKEEFENKVKKLIIKINNEKSKQHDKKSLNFNITADLSEGFYLITDNEINYGFANKDYQIIIKPKYEYAESFCNGLALVRLNGKFGFINKEGNLIIGCKYDYAESFKHETAFVKEQNDTFYINQKGEKIKVKKEQTKTEYNKQDFDNSYNIKFKDLIPIFIIFILLVGLIVVISIYK